MTLDPIALLPALAPLAAALLLLVLDVINPRWSIAGWLAQLGLAVGAAGTLPYVLGRWDGRGSVCVPEVGCLFTLPRPLAVLALFALLGAMAVVALLRQRLSLTDGVLLLAATSGAVVVCGARDLGTWLIGLELATLPVVLLVALQGRRALAGAVQLLMTSLVSFALLVLAAALWFASTGTILLGPSALNPSLPAQPGAATTAALALAAVLALAGLGFKLSLAPFHAWTPTAYSGSSIPIAVFLAVVSKIAALAGIVVILGGLASAGQHALIAPAVLAAISMTVGNVMALRQTDLVRLLAYSTVAQAGWVVMPLVAPNGGGVGAAAFYVLAYAIATLVAFAAIQVVAGEVDASESPGAGRNLESFRGLWQRSPWWGGALVLALASLAGLPPGILGLVGKIVALRPVLAEGWYALGIVAVINVVLGVAVYLRWIAVVIAPIDADTLATGSGAPARSAMPSRSVLVVLGVATAVLVLLCIQPQLLLGLVG